MAKILLAEDDTFLRDVYHEALKGDGFEVFLAVDGEEAFQKIKEGGWDVVLLDIVMPKMTGIDVLKKLGSDPKAFAKHIVLLTNTEETKELDEVSGMFDGLVMKSAITPGQLLDKVKAYLV
jgi:CheY-like chemotaxis protein